MRVKKCVFCGNDSTNSKSVEHIIPESLGNKEYYLAKGIVCDKCNNYFARKIEEPVLSLDLFKSIRFYNFIENKKGNIPQINGLINGANAKIHWEKVNNKYSLFIRVQPEVIPKVVNSPPKIFITNSPDINEINYYNYEISRFLVKVALEYYIYLIINSSEFENEEDLELEFDETLQKFNDFLRRGRKDKKFFSYEVETNLNECEDYRLVVKFELRNDELLFVMEIQKYKFIMNITNNKLI